MKMGMTSIIIPTFNNQDIYLHCLRSLLSFTDSNIEIHTVYNGEDYDLQVAYPDMSGLPDLHFHKTNKNLGWMGGINYCKDKVQGEYVLMLNDDTQILDYDNKWLERLKLAFYCTNLGQKNSSVTYDSIGAVGPVSNAVMGGQSIIYSREIPHKMYTVPMLSGFCLLLKKDILDEVGWLDESLRGADDIDLSFRLLDAGYKLAVRRDVFVYHRYAITGKKLFGNYWDSLEHSENAHIDMIRKHGLKRVIEFEMGNLKATKIKVPAGA